MFIPKWGCSLKIVSVKSIRLFQKGPHTWKHWWSPLRILATREISIAKSHFCSMYIKTCAFFGKRRRHDMYCRTPWFFSLNSVSQDYVHSSWLQARAHCRDRRRRPAHYVHVHSQPSTRRIPFAVALWGRQSTIKVQVLCRNTSDRYSAQVLVTGTSRGFKSGAWGWRRGRTQHGMH